MIFEILLNAVWHLLDFVFGFIPSIPQVPSAITSAIDNVFNFIFDNCGLLGVFVPLGIVKVLIPLWLIVENFDKIYSLIFWIIKKIPFINIRQ